MDEWEYKLIDSHYITKGFLKGRPVEMAIEYLNQLGNDGWEVINLDFDGLAHDAGTFVGIAKRKKR